MRTAVLMLAFVTGLGLSSAALRVLARRNESPTRGILEHMQQHQAEYDLIVLGPSFVRKHFIPPVFERRMAEHGYKLKAFGFGIPALVGGEFDFYLDQILALPLPRTKWLLCDVTLDQMLPLNEGNYFKRRLVYWHTPEQFLFMARALLAGDGPWSERLSRGALHARHALLNLFNVGEGVVAVSEGSWFAPPRRAPGIGKFFPEQWSKSKLKRLVRKYMKRQEADHLAAAARLAEARAHTPAQPRPNAMMRAWRDRIRARGLQPTFLLSPTLEDRRFRTEVPGDEPLQVLDFNDPNRYPQLYEPKMRYDWQHLNYEGARRYSELLADSFAAMLDARPGERARLSQAAAGAKRP